MSPQNKRKRLTIGVLLGSLEESYQSRIWPGFADYSEEKDINLIIMVGKSLYSPYDFDYQHNSIYGLASRERLDGIVLMSGTLGNFLNRDEVYEFSQRYYDLPQVSIALPINGITSIVVDNTSGIKESISHLVEIHGHKRIAYIRGPFDHDEADKRFNAYRESLNKYNIPYDENLIVAGNFVKDMGENAVKLLLNKRKCKFDSIVAANDNMAIGALNELKRQKFRVPHDIAIIGFDDTDESNYINPPLTTVKQPLYQLAVSAIDALLNIINGKKVKEIIYLPTKLIIRQSCGCFFQSVTRISEKKVYSEQRLNFIDEIDRNSNKIITGIIRSLRISYKYTKLVKSWISLLIDNFKEDLVKEDTYENFFYTLNEIFIEIINYNQNIYQWQKALDLFREEIISCINDYKYLCKAEFMFQKARVLFGEIMMRNTLNYRMQIEKSIFMLQQVSQGLITSFEINELMDIMALELPRLGIKECYISLYNGVITSLKSIGWNIPEWSELVFAYNDNGRFGLRENKIRFKSKALLPDGLLPANRALRLILMPLFFKDENFGFILFDIGQRVEIVYETLRGQISSALKGAMLFKERVKAENELKDALVKLERTNKKLHRLSLADELTGLYNRRGFLALGKQHLFQSKKTRNPFIIFFADMDNLKYINDNLGHDEGDNAIVKTAEILEKIFRQIDIIARYGGDEFVILAADITLENVDKFIGRLKKKFMDYNAMSDKPYDLSLSIGYAFYDVDSETSFEELISTADKMLYKEKHSKKLK